MNGAPTRGYCSRAAEFKEKILVQSFNTLFQLLRGNAREAASIDLLSQLLLPSRHSPLLGRRRAEMIISRVRMIAVLFAFLTPLWIVIDVVIFTWPVTILLVAARLIATVAFGMLALSLCNSTQLADARRALAFLFCIPTVFFLYSHPMLSYFGATGPAAALAAGYAFLPFVMIAGLSVFPLTAVEAAVFALPVLVAEGFIALVQLDLLSWSSHLGAFWLLLLIATVAALAGMSQLSFMVSLVQQATHDGLTGCFSRSSGEELLGIQFQIATRSGARLSAVFLDIDDFKLINDTFGHEAGDCVLSKIADMLRANLRSCDVLVRWGGEEFVIVLPDTSGDTAALVVGRLLEQGLGMRPDGTPVTASFGIAERVTDQAKDWLDLIDSADQRMYLAKRSGKNRVEGCAGPQSVSSFHTVPV